MAIAIAKTVWVINTARMRSRERYARYRNETRHREKDRDPGGFHGAVGPPAKQRKLGLSQRSFFQLFWAFWHLVRQDRPLIILSIVVLSVSTLLGLLPPVGTKVVIDYVLAEPPLTVPPWTAYLQFPASPRGRLFWLAITIVSIVLVQTLIHLWGRWMATRSVQRTVVAMRHKLFEKAIRLPLHQVYKLKSGGVASLLREDAGGIGELIFSMVFNPFRAIVQFCGSLIILSIVDWRLMAGGLLLAPIVWLTHRTYVNRIRPVYKDIRKQRQSIDATATEVFSGIRVVRTFARARTEAARYVSESNFLVRQTMLSWWQTRAIEIVWEVLIPLASVSLLVYGGFRILDGNLTLGDLMMFLVYLTMLLGPLATLVGSAVQFQSNLAGLDRVLDILEMPEEMPRLPSQSRVVREKVQGKIEFDQVSFRYPETDRDVLNDITFTAYHGQSIALVGPSGSGKTTLCNLVARFYDPTSGRILLDGVDLRDLTVDSYRSLLGMVEQEVFLFDGSVRENIAYGRRSATDQEVVDAAQAAAAHEFIEKLPQGYDSLIGERGVKLSGGQRQRLAIARALLADPKILILDEATSSLDSENEQLIQQSLQRLLSQRTSFVIAHRLSTIVNADQILVVENGRIVQQGTHDDLSRQNGKYQEMLKLQIRPPASPTSRSSLKPNS
jgi:ATP-binding cassette, subfamily B, bacterial